MRLFKPQIRTKNFSADDLKARNAGIGEFPMRAIVRFGSRTTTAEAYPNAYGVRPIIEVNTPEACHNSGDKILMKECFDRAGVKTAKWKLLISTIGNIDEWDIYPAIVKHKNSCKGKGIYLIENREDLVEFNRLNRLSDYIIEQYLPYTKEYRLHVTKNGCFYTCRKMLKSDAEERWHRHDTNSVWIMEENQAFDKPKNWDDVVSECVKALNAVGLTVGACDIKIQSEKGKRADYVPDFVILEINSAPSFGTVTLEKYRQELPKIINDKIANYGKE